mmetsp:Transcript_13215/g.18089  ORF Transcript_13215/g.18089 Transcript_13215/m.18089 type:complete len:165 (+) Transcript_13215:348-842(+)
MLRQTLGGNYCQKYTTSKRNIIETEHYLLRVLNFVMEEDLPQKYMLNFSRYLNLSAGIVQNAWKYLNDSFFTSVCVSFTPEEIACGCLCIAIFEIQCEEHSNATAIATKDEFLNAISQDLSQNESVWSTRCPWKLFGVSDSRLVAVVVELVHSRFMVQELESTS